MKKLLVLSLSFFLLMCSFAQENIIDLEGVFKGKYRVQGRPNLSWRPSTNQISILKNDTIFLKNPQSTKKTVFLCLSDVQKKIADINTLRGFSWVDQNSIFLSQNNLMITVTETGIQVKEFPIKKQENIIDYNLKESIFVVKVGKNVFVKSALNNFEPVLLCPDTGKNIVFGESVHRNEWGIGEGQYISSNGKYIAFYRMDESMVDDYPLVDITADVRSSR